MNCAQFEVHLHVARVRGHSFITYAQISGFQTHPPPCTHRLWRHYDNNTLAYAWRLTPLPPFGAYVLNEWPPTWDQVHCLMRHFIAERNLQIADRCMKIVINVDDLVKIWSLSIVYRCEAKCYHTLHTDMVKDIQSMGFKALFGKQVHKLIGIWDWSVILISTRHLLPTVRHFVCSCEGLQDADLLIMKTLCRTKKRFCVKLKRSVG